MTIKLKNELDAMRYIDEALLNIRRDYPEEKTAAAHQAFGFLSGRLGYSLERCIILTAEGFVFLEEE